MPNLLRWPFKRTPIRKPSELRAIEPETLPDWGKVLTEEKNRAFNIRVARQIAQREERERLARMPWWRRYPAMAWRSLVGRAPRRPEWRL